ncbi:MAG: AAA family ATPase [Desulfobacterales bacterium]|nr:AAA family ATPase [Desulfobacterales bacterium]
MYRNHFHLKERPFQLVPTPAYLYPSRCHQDALAHLRYALESGEGFVELTGEVGTGKTTLLRTFLEGLDDSVAVACIFNPTLNAVELLQSINRDFGVAPSSTSRSDLTAYLHRFLVENREAGRKALLVVDEAQNLSVEVLEELRLLSNLETTKSKLLQTVLCGQPELGEMLERHELRQLAQRISLSCRLRPLSLEETHDYIVHRCCKAALGDGSDLFSKGARDLIYRFSQGIPRIINICCDRALLCAYGAHRKRVDKVSVKEALAELSDRPYMASLFMSRTVMKAAVITLLVAMVLGAGFFLSGRYLSPVGTPSLPSAAETHEAVSPSSSTYTLSDLFDESAVFHSATWAITRIMRFWGKEMVEDAPTEITDPYLLLSAVAASRHMEVVPVDGTFEPMLRFQLPALVLFKTGLGVPLALVYDGLSPSGMLRFQSEKGGLEMNRVDVERLWTGRAFIAFVNPLGFSETVWRHSSSAEVIALETALVRAGFSAVRVDGVFDELTLGAIHAIQSACAIAEDGKVGAQTRVALAAAIRNGGTESSEDLSVGMHEVAP